MKSFWHNLEKPITALAPMEELTDTVFRQMVNWCGRPDVFFTEFTSTEGLFSKGRDSVIHRLKYTKQEKPLVAQIWGVRPENFLKTAELIREMDFDGLDINMGCPVHKIIKKGGCAALIDNPSLAKELFLAAKEGAGQLPVSIKTRIGFGEVKTEEWISVLLDLKPEVLTIHGRIAKHRLKYRAKWDEIKKAVDLRDQLESSTLIIGNGDVRDREEIIEKSDKYKVDGIMVGRGILHNLYLFREKDPHNHKALSREEKLNLLLKHIELFEETWGNRKFFGELKKFFKYYASGFEGAPALRSSLVQSESLNDVKNQIKAEMNNTF